MIKSPIAISGGFDAFVNRSVDSLIIEHLNSPIGERQ